MDSWNRFIYLSPATCTLVCTCVCVWGFPGSSVVENPPGMQDIQETQVQSPGWVDPLEKEMATHSSILAWEIKWTQSLVVHRVKKSQTQLSD